MELIICQSTIPAGIFYNETLQQHITPWSSDIEIIFMLALLISPRHLSSLIDDWCWCKYAVVDSIIFPDNWESGVSGDNDDADCEY